MFVLCIIFTSAIMYHTDLLHSHPEMTDCLGWAATAGDHLRLLLSFSHFNFWRCVNQSKIKINTTQRSVFGQIKRKTFLCWNYKMHFHLLLKNIFMNNSSLFWTVYFLTCCLLWISFAPFLRLRDLDFSMDVVLQVQGLSY